MASKAKAKAEKSGAKAKSSPPSSTTDRITIDQAFQEFLRHHGGDGYAAREDFDRALRIGGTTRGIRLWANDEVVSPNWYAAHLRLEADVAAKDDSAKGVAKGDWFTELAQSGSRFVDPRRFVWTVSKARVTAFLERTPLKHAGGRPPKHSREELLIEAAVYVVVNGLPEGGNEGLANALAAELGIRSPGRTFLTEVLAPFHKRMSAVLKSGN